MQAPGLYSIFSIFSGSVTTTEQIAESPRERMRSISASTISCPALTRSPADTCKTNPSPARLTVSTPMCTSTSAPLSLISVTAWRESVTDVIFPSTGAKNRPSVGSIPIPSPKSPLANTSSGTVESGTVLPVQGERRHSVFFSIVYHALPTQMQDRNNRLLK